MSGHNQHYDTIADAYSEARRANAGTYAYWTYHFEEMMQMVDGDLSGMAVLDCMAGACTFSQVAQGTVKALHATDISPGILSKAEAPLPDSRICADALKLPYATDSFDAVFISGGLHHVHAIHGDVLLELHRIIRNGGWLVVSEPNDDNPFIHLMRSILHVVSPLYEEGEKGFKQTDLAQSLRQTGFTDIVHQPRGYVAYTLIGNTDVFPLLANLKNKKVIDGLINIDRVSTNIPLWRSMALVHLMSARVYK